MLPRREDPWQERRRLEPVVAGGRARRSAIRRMAELEYLLGDYAAAEALVRSPVLLALIHYQRKAQIDTGGDMLTLPAGLGIEPVVTMEGRWAGGARGAMSYGRVASVRLGDVTLTDVPVTTAGHDRAIIGTGLLRQFLPTLDYPRARLILRPRDAVVGDGTAVPFALALTHLIVTRGSLDGRSCTLVVDSGLEDDRGAMARSRSSSAAWPVAGSTRSSATTFCATTRGRSISPR